jgi:hypothetical protein
MSNTDHVFVTTPIAGAVGLVGSILAANPLIEKRLSHVESLEREAGRLPRMVQWLYVWPQLEYRWGLLAISLLACAMIGAFLLPSSLAQSLAQFVRSYGWVLVALWLTLAGMMYTNGLSRVKIWVGLLLTSIVPIRNLFGLKALKEYPNWPALRALVNLNENAKPLMIDESASEVFADALIRKFQREPTPPADRAEAPELPATAERDFLRKKVGNALLAGCIIESAHNVPGSGFPTYRDWNPFYDAIAELALATDLMSPQRLSAECHDSRYYGNLCNDLNRRLLQLGQQTFPDSPLLLERLQQAFEFLVSNYAGDATQIDPRSDRFLRSRMEIIEQRVNAFPGLGGEGIRRQFIKLAAVWDVWIDLPLGHFESAFSKRLAALLLDRGVIRVTGDLKSISFDSPEDREAYRAATRSIIDNATRLVNARREDNEMWLPQKSRMAYAELFRWWVAYEVDFRLWHYASRLHSAAGIPNDPGLKKWKYSEGRINRVDGSA